MVNLRPEDSSYSESKGSLEFAKEVSKCVLAPAQKNYKSGNAGTGIPPVKRGSKKA